MSVEVNDRKRDEMRWIVRRLLAGQGWKPAQLAAWMGVTPSTIARWFRGASMGTNAQRYALSKMGSPADERPRILDAVRHMRQEADLSEGMLIADEQAGAHNVSQYRRARIARIRARADALAKLFGYGL